MTSAASGPTRTLPVVAIMAAGFGAMLNLYAPQAILPLLAAEFDAGPVRIGLTITATTVAVALFGPLAGAVADRVGRKRAIVGAIAGLAIPTALCGLATGLDQLVVLRFVQGMFMPAAFAASLAYIAEGWAEPDLSRVSSLYIAANLSGGFAGRFLGGLAAAHADWHWAFYALALVNAAAALVVWLCLPSPRQVAPTQSFGASLRAIGMHLTNRRLLTIYAVGFNVLFGLMAIFTFVNFHLAAPPYRLSTAALGLVFCVYLVGIVITPFAGRAIGKVGQRRAILVAVGVATFGCLLTLAPSLPVIVAGLAIFCSSVFVCQAASTSRIGRVAGQNRSSAAGLYLSFYYAGGALGATLPGYAYQAFGWPGCVAVAVAVQGIVAALAAMLWIHPEPALTPEHSSGSSPRSA